MKTVVRKSKSKSMFKPSVFSHKVEAVLLCDISSEQPYRAPLLFKKGTQIIVDLMHQLASFEGTRFDVVENEYRIINQN